MPIALTDKDQSIISQVAAKITSELVSAAFAHDADVTTEKLVSEFAVHFGMVNEALLSGITGQVVANAFPGSTEVASAPVNVFATVAAQAAPVPVSGPAAIPGVTDGDPAQAALWQDILANPQNWHDNRNDPQRPARAPEFRHKSQMDAAGKYKVGLYINDKKNPSNVAQIIASLRF